MKKIIPAWGNFPLSAAIVNDCKYEMEISGQIWMNLETWVLENGIEAQTIKALDNTRENLEKIGWNMDNVIKARIFLTSMDDYGAMNDAYASYFNGEYPTRFALEVSALPAWALVEIECKAVGDSISE